MSRYSDITSKLEYIEYKRQEMMQALFNAKKEKCEPSYFKHIVADILSSTRECFDYCAKDILENKIIVNTSNEKLIARFNDGKIRAYFPFYKNELENRNNPFYELKDIQVDFYQHLIKLADNFASDNLIPNTLLKYSDLIKLKDLVNEKKHDKLIAIESNSNQEYIIEDNGFSMVIPIKEQKGWDTFKVSEDSKVSIVSEFRLEYIDEEISMFCMGANKSTEIIIKEIYTNFLT